MGSFPLGRVDTGSSLAPPGSFFLLRGRRNIFCCGAAKSAAPWAAHQHLERARHRACTRCSTNLCCFSSTKLFSCNAQKRDVQWLWGKLGDAGCTQLRLTCCVLHGCGCACIAALCFTVLREICDEIFLHWSTTLSASPPHNLRMTCLLVPAILFYYYYYNYIYYYYY